MISNKKQVTVVINDPAADARIPLLRAPATNSVTIERAFGLFPIALSASTANYVNFSLLNGGTDHAGTALISDEVGGTAGWAADAMKELTIVDGSGKLTAGQVLVLNYAETGTVAAVCMAIVVEYVDGIGEKASA